MEEETAVQVENREGNHHDGRNQSQHLNRSLSHQTESLAAAGHRFNDSFVLERLLGVKGEDEENVGADAHRCDIFDERKWDKNGVTDDRDEDIRMFEGKDDDDEVEGHADGEGEESEGDGPVDGTGDDEGEHDIEQEAHDAGLAL